jgi:hypothetical protein
MEQQEYLTHSRSLAVSFVFILPLLVAYEAGMLILRPESASLAGNLIWWLLYEAFGQRAAVVFNLIVIAAVGASLVAMRKTGGVRISAYPLVLAEGFAYGLFLWRLMPLIIVYVVPLAQGTGPTAAGMADEIILSIGAGLYEEIVFRLGLMSLIYFLLVKMFDKRWLAAATAILVSSLVFSAAHYLGPTDMSTAEFVRSFVYRTLGGIFFAALYIYRGLAVACYSHAFYDILVVAFR